MVPIISTSPSGRLAPIRPEVIPKATIPQVNNGCQRATEFRVPFRYPNDVEMLVTDTGRNGILFEGSEGRIFVNRGSLSGVPVDDLVEQLPLARRSALRIGQSQPTRAIW